MGANQRERLLVIATVVCIVAFAGDRFVAGPMLESWDARAERIHSLERSLANGKQLLAREDALAARWKQIQDRTLSADGAEAELEVLAAANQWAKESRVALTSLKPRLIEAEDEHQLLEVRAAAQGSIESVGRFLYALERDARALKLEEVLISAKDGTGRNLSLTVRFTGLIVLEKKNGS